MKWGGSGIELNNIFIYKLCILIIIAVKRIWGSGGRGSCLEGGSVYVICRLKRAMVESNVTSLMRRRLG